MEDWNNLNGYVLTSPQPLQELDEKLIHEVLEMKEEEEKTKSQATPLHLEHLFGNSEVKGPILPPENNTTGQNPAELFELRSPTQFLNPIPMPPPENNFYKPDSEYVVATAISHSSQSVTMEQEFLNFQFVQNMDYGNSVNSENNEVILNAQEVTMYSDSNSSAPSPCPSYGSSSGQSKGRNTKGKDPDNRALKAKIRYLEKKKKNTTRLSKDEEESLRRLKNNLSCRESRESRNSKIKKMEKELEEKKAIDEQKKKTDALVRQLQEKIHVQNQILITLLHAEETPELVKNYIQHHLPL